MDGKKCGDAKSRVQLNVKDLRVLVRKLLTIFQITPDLHIEFSIRLWWWINSLKHCTTWFGSCSSKNHEISTCIATQADMEIRISMTNATISVNILTFIFSQSIYEIWNSCERIKCIHKSVNCIDICKCIKINHGIERTKKNGKNC